jgi:hypothetical protein
LECEKGEAYSEKIQFAHTIIQDIDTTRTFKVEFLCRSRRCWHVRKHIKLRTTLVNSVCIEEWEEGKAKEHHFVEA